MYRRICVALSFAVSCTSARSPASEGMPASDATPSSQSAVAAFLQGMISHHAQALEMTALVPQRASHPGLRLLAERIDVSQKDEITLMQRWLRNRGRAVPAGQAHVHAAREHAPLMPGMLTPEQLAQLAAARGPAFDRLFLQQMIRHHEGALQMVAELLATHRDLDAETFRFVSDVDADQRAEIQRMQTLLKTLP